MITLKNYVNKLKVMQNLIVMIETMQQIILMKMVMIVSNMEMKPTMIALAIGTVRIKVKTK